MVFKKIESYKDLEIWKEGMALAERIYRVTDSFPKQEVYGLVSQVRRAAISIPANIAEGCARNHSKEFRQFLYIALGSLAELGTLVELSERLHFVIAETAVKLDETIKVLRYRILALLRKLS